MQLSSLPVFLWLSRVLSEYRGKRGTAKNKTSGWHYRIHRPAANRRSERRRNFCRRPGKTKKNQPIDIPTADSWLSTATRYEPTGFLQAKSRQTVQQTEVEELGKFEYPSVQHGRGELFGNGGPQIEPGCFEQSARLQHAQTAYKEIVWQSEPGGLESDEHIFRVRTDRRETQQQQPVCGKRPATQSQSIVTRRVF